MRFRHFILFLIPAVLFAAGCETHQASPPPPVATSAPLNVEPSVDIRRVELANLRADLQALDRRVRELGILTEDLARQNRDLTTQLERLQRAQPADTVRQADLNRAVRELEQRQDAAAVEQRRLILSQVSQQIEQLGKQTQAAIDTLARGISTPPATGQTTRAPTTFSDDFPKEGITYTVQRGDTLSGIAARHNSTVRDIQNANRIANPEAIQIGQVLFIPQRKE